MLWFMNRVTDLPNWRDIVDDDSAIKNLLSWLNVQGDISQLSPDDDDVKRNVLVDLLGSMPRDLAAGGFTKVMAKCCVRELREKVIASGYLDIVRVLDCETAAFKINQSTAFNHAVKTAMTGLERRAAVSDGSNGVLLPIVDAAMYPFVDWHTPVLDEPRLNRRNCIESIGSGHTAGIMDRGPVRLERLEARRSKRRRNAPKGPNPDFALDALCKTCIYSQLLTDVKIGRRGCSLDGYINNVNPSEHFVYEAVEQLLDVALPAFQAVVQDTLDNHRAQWMRPRHRYAWPTARQLAECKDPSFCATRTNKTTFRTRFAKIDRRCQGYEEELDREWELFQRNHTAADPEPAPLLDNPNYDAKCPWNKLQVIVSVTAHRLTPARPHFAGEEWHVEGFDNEMIVAVGLYCYALENVTTPRVALQTYGRGGRAERVPDFAADFYHDAMQGLYGADVFAKDRANMPFGSLAVQEGRMLVVPNVVMRRLEPFELKDTSKPGHMKTVTIALVDPKHPILSTAFVPPQDWAWARSSRTPLGAVLRRLPVELSDMVLGYLGCPFDRKLARLIRDDMVEDRLAGCPYIVDSDDDAGNSSEEGSGDDSERVSAQVSEQISEQ